MHLVMGSLKKFLTKLLLLILLVPVLMPLRSPCSDVDVDVIVVVVFIHVWVFLWPFISCSPSWEWPPAIPWHNLLNLDRCHSKVFRCLCSLLLSMYI